MYPNDDTARRMIESAFGPQHGPDPFETPTPAWPVQCRHCGHCATYTPPQGQPGAARPIAIYLQCRQCGTLYQIA